MRTCHALDRRQLEDVQDGRRGAGPGRRGARRCRDRATSTSSSRPPFTALAAVAEVLQGHAGRPRRPEHARGARRAPSPARSRPRCSRTSGCTHVILGHSERRQLFGETDESVAKKAARRPRPRPDPHRLRRARPWPSGSRPHLRGGRAPGRARPARPDRRPGGRAIAGGLRAGLGHRHRARPRRPEQAQEVHAFIRKRDRPLPRRAGARARSGSSTAAASSPTTSAP